MCGRRKPGTCWGATSGRWAGGQRSQCCGTTGDSTDIDHFLRRDEWLSWLAGGGPRRMEEVANNKGWEFLVAGRKILRGRPWREGPPTAYKVRGIEYAPGRTGAIDIVQTAYDFGYERNLGSRRARTFPRMNAASILAGKLGGRPQIGKPRDLYDLAVAMLEDEKAGPGNGVMERILPHMEHERLGKFAQEAARLVKSGEWEGEAVQRQLRNPRREEARANGAGMVELMLTEHLAEGAEPTRTVEPAKKRGVER